MHTATNHTRETDGKVANSERVAITTSHMYLDNELIYMYMYMICIHTCIRYMKNNTIQFVFDNLLSTSSSCNEGKS